LRSGRRVNEANKRSRRRRNRRKSGGENRQRNRENGEETALITRRQARKHAVAAARNVNGMSGGSSVVVKSGAAGDYRMSMWLIGIIKAKESECLLTYREITLAAKISAANQHQSNGGMA